MANTTKKAALQATELLDRTASFLQSQYETYGISKAAAHRIAWNLDAVADHIEKSAGIHPKDVRGKQALAGFDPEQIGEEVGGPLEQESDEPYMSAEFSQQENRELREKQQAGELPVGSPAPQPPKAGVQAKLDTKKAVQASLDAGAKLAQAYLEINKAASACAGSKHASVVTLGTKLASTGLGVLQFQTRVLEGRESAARAAALLTATNHVIPHLAGELAPEIAVKLARMADILTGLTKNAGDESEEEEDDDQAEAA